MRVLAAVFFNTIDANLRKLHLEPDVESDVNQHNYPVPLPDGLGIKFVQGDRKFMLPPPSEDILSIIPEIPSQAHFLQEDTVAKDLKGGHRIKNQTKSLHKKADAKNSLEKEETDAKEFNISLESNIKEKPNFVQTQSIVYHDNGPSHHCYNDCPSIDAPVCYYGKTQYANRCLAICDYAKMEYIREGPCTISYDHQCTTDQVSLPFCYYWTQELNLCQHDPTGMIHGYEDLIVDKVKDEICCESCQCVDRIGPEFHCEYWAENNYCNDPLYPQIREYCCSSCSCADRSDYCPHWAEMRGCTEEGYFEEGWEKYCAGSCEIGVGCAVDNSNCFDEDFCHHMEELYACDPEHKEHCRRMCGECTCFDRCSPDEIPIIENCSCEPALCENTQGFDCSDRSKCSHDWETIEKCPELCNLCRCPLPDATEEQQPSSDEHKANLAQVSCPPNTICNKEQYCVPSTCDNFVCTFPFGPKSGPIDCTLDSIAGCGFLECCEQRATCEQFGEAQCVNADKTLRLEPKSILCRLPPSTNHHVDSGSGCDAERCCEEKRCSTVEVTCDASLDQIFDEIKCDRIPRSDTTNCTVNNCCGTACAAHFLHCHATQQKAFDPAKCGNFVSTDTHHCNDFNCCVTVPLCTIVDGSAPSISTNGCGCGISICKSGQYCTADHHVCEDECDISLGFDCRYCACPDGRDCQSDNKCGPLPNCEVTDGTLPNTLAGGCVCGTAATPCAQNEFCFISTNSCENVCDVSIAHDCTTCGCPFGRLCDSSGTQECGDLPTCDVIDGSEQITRDGGCHCGTNECSNGQYCYSVPDVCEDECDVSIDEDCTNCTCPKHQSCGYHSGLKVCRPTFDCPDTDGQTAVSLEYCTCNNQETCEKGEFCNHFEQPGCTASPFSAPIPPAEDCTVYQIPDSANPGQCCDDLNQNGVCDQIDVGIPSGPSPPVTSSGLLLGEVCGGVFQSIDSECAGKLVCLADPASTDGTKKCEVPSDDPTCLTTFTSFGDYTCSDLQPFCDDHTDLLKNAAAQFCCKATCSE